MRARNLIPRYEVEEFVNPGISQKKASHTYVKNDTYDYKRNHIIQVCDVHHPLAFCKVTAVPKLATAKILNSI